MRAVGDAIVVYKHRASRRELVGLGVTFLVAGAVALLMDGAPTYTYFTDSTWQAPFLLWIPLALLMVIGGAACFILAATARRRKAALIVNQAGIVDWCSRGLRGNQGMIPWSEIASVTAEAEVGPVVVLESLVIHRFMTPALAENRPLLDIDPSLRAHDPLTTGVVRIYTTQMDASASDVARAISDYLQTNPPPGWRGDTSTAAIPHRAPTM